MDNTCFLIWLAWDWIDCRRDFTISNRGSNDTDLGTVLNCDGPWLLER